jgi:hypothetical protein
MKPRRTDGPGSSFGQMAVRKSETFPPMTMGHIRGLGCQRHLLAAGRNKHRNRA